VENAAEKATRVFEALTRFGAPLDSDKINRDTFTEKDLTYQMGVAPIRRTSDLEQLNNLYNKTD
jgi:hypothetical protein